MKYENNIGRSEYSIKDENTFKLKTDKDLIYFGPVKPSFSSVQKITIEALNSDFLIKELEIS